jgi:predicted RNA methylase
MTVSAISTAAHAATAATTRLPDLDATDHADAIALVGPELSAGVDYRNAAEALHHAAQTLHCALECGQRLGAASLRTAMETAFGASDATGAWDWRLAYEASEAATVLFLRRYGPALIRKAGSHAAMLPLLAKLARLLPTQTRRSEESSTFQQFSTPIDLGWAAVTAASIQPGDVVLEPSAGTGLLAIFAELQGGKLVLNELADTRAHLLGQLFPSAPVTRFDAAQIDDHLGSAIWPSVVIMNPPFSAMAQVTGRAPDAAFRHIRSALARLEHGGRLVAITGAGFSAEAPVWRDAFIRLQEQVRVVFTGHRRFCLRSPWHNRRDAFDRDRQGGVTGCVAVPAVAGHGAGCRHAARLDRAGCAAKSGSDP